MVSSDAIVVWLENVRKDDIHIVGGKCANLGELTAKGVTVPPGFAVTADAFRRFLEETKIGEVIQKTLTSADGPRDPKQYEEASQAIRKIIESAPMPLDIANEVRSAYRDLERKTSNPQVKVAVRSSATSEDRPDRFIIDKGTLQIVHKEIVPKMVEHVPNHQTGLTMEREVPAERRNAASLGDEQVVELARLARDIEDHYQTPQDVEFAVERSKSGQKVYVVQTRPETFWARMKSPSESGKSPVLDRVVVVQGLAASPGLHAGRAKIVVGLQDAGRMKKDKDILVTRMTNPDWVPYMTIAGAIVTEDGGTTCHAAIVSREMGIPCIVGARNATKVLQTGKEYTVDAKAGVVYQGLVEDVLKPAAAVGQQIPTVIPVTSTRIYVNISLPELAEKVARETHADGVGLLRAEHMMLSVGKHPRLLIEEGGGQKMVDAFAEGVRKVATPFAPRPVVYRCLDFKPDEFLGLPGGEKYEHEAGHVGPNPLLGYRGCFRYVKEPDIFRLECQAIKKVREEYKLTNVHVMLPFVRTLEDFRNAKKILEEEGLKRSPDFKLWIMCEVPATVLLIDKFVLEGIDGISFGTNDLTMLILGIDRDDASIQESYDERNLAVLLSMRNVIWICSEAAW